MTRLPKVDDLQTKYLDIISGLKAHLEFQNALGIGLIELYNSPSASAKRAEAEPAAGRAPAARTGADRASVLDGIRLEMGGCTRCGLHKGRTQIVFGDGDPNAGLVFVGEGPGSEEDRQGLPFVGEAGQLLTRIIENGMKLRRSDVYICNIVKCRPPNNRTPRSDEIEACLPFVKRQIEAISPHIIVTLGNVPTQALLGTRDGITRLRGIWRTYKGIPLMPTFHPAYLLRNPGDKRVVWEDVQKVMARLAELSGR